MDPAFQKNMVNIIMIFPEREREEVIPVDNPTVPIAEISSKKSYNKIEIFLHVIAIPTSL